MDKLHISEQASDDRKLKTRLFRMATEALFYSPTTKSSQLTLLALQGVVSEDGSPLVMSSRVVGKDEFEVRESKGEVSEEDAEDVLRDASKVEIVYFPPRLQRGEPLGETVMVQVHNSSDIDVYKMQSHRAGLSEDIDASFAKVGEGAEQRPEATLQDLKTLQTIFRSIRKVNF